MVAVVSMFTINLQYRIREPVKALLITEKENKPLNGTFMGRERKVFARKKMITTLLDTNENVIKTHKLAGVTEVVLSLDELNNTDNLEDGRLSNILLGYQVTGLEEFTRCKPVTPQCKKLY